MGSSPTVQRNKDAKDDDYYILWVSFKKKEKKKENSQMVPSEQRILIFLKIAIPNILLYTRLSIKSNNIFLLL